MCTFLKDIISRFFFLSLFKGNKLIVCYHDISDPDSLQYSEHYSTSIQLFKEQIHFFKKHFEIVSIDELLNGQLKKSKNYLAISFDDGFQSVKENAHPFLKGLNLPYTIFINKMAVLGNQLWVSNMVLQENNLSYINSIIGDNHSNLKDPIYQQMYEGSFDTHFQSKYYLEHYEKADRVYLNKDDLKALQEDGVEIGNHSTEHFNLKNTDEHLMQSSIDENHQFIKDNFNVESTLFALPFGKKEHYNSMVINYLKTKGYNNILTTNPVLFKENETLTPRLVVTNETISDLKFYINRSFLKKPDL